MKKHKILIITVLFLINILIVTFALLLVSHGLVFAATPGTPTAPQVTPSPPFYNPVTGTVTPTAAFVCPVGTIDTNSLDPGYLNRCRSCFPSTVTSTSERIISTEVIIDCAIVRAQVVGTVDTRTVYPTVNLSQSPTLTINPCLATCPPGGCNGPTATKTLTTTAVPPTTSPVPTQGLHYYAISVTSVSDMGYGSWIYASQAVCNPGDTAQGWALSANIGNPAGFNIYAEGANHGASGGSGWIFTEMGVNTYVLDWLANNLASVGWGGYTDKLTNYYWGAPQYPFSSGMGIDPLSIRGNGLILCYGNQNPSATSTPTATSTPPTATPTINVTISGCNQVVYRNSTPVVTWVGPIDWTFGGCYLFVPPFALDTPQILIIPPLHVSWDGFGVCTYSMAFPTWTILGISIPIELVLLPLVMGAVMLIIRI